MNESSFSLATLAQRLAAIFSEGPWKQLAIHSDLCLAEGEIGGRKVLVVATDPARVLGTFGICECDDFQWALQRARATGSPLVLLLDSAGARLNAGLPIQGALRSLMRAMLDARFAELPMLTVIGRYAFGAASMVAAATSVRLHAAGSLVAMSGPRVLAAHPDNHLSQDSLRRRISGQARCAQSSTDLLIDDNLDSFAFAVRAWAAHPTAYPVTRQTLATERQRLRARLLDNGMCGGGVMRRLEDTLSCASASFGAGEVLALCDRLDHELATGRPMTLAIDCPGHSVAMQDEEIYLTQYLVHLAMSLRYYTRRGAEVRLQIRRQISGGIYIVLAAGATLTELAHGAMVRTLPSSALLQILGDDTPETPDGAGHLEWGVVDLLRPLHGTQNDAGELTLA